MCTSILQGLAFTFVSKAGAVVSGMVGHGFVFRKARGSLDFA